MKRKLFLFSLITFVLALAIAGCQREGCTDPKATNYDPDAKKDNGTCVYAEPEPTPVVPTKEITLELSWADALWGEGKNNVDTVKKYTDMEDVKFVFLSLGNGQTETTTFSTCNFHQARDTMQTRFDISPKVMGSGTIIVDGENGAQMPSTTTGTGMALEDSIWFASKGYKIKRSGAYSK